MLKLSEKSTTYMYFYKPRFGVSIEEQEGVCSQYGIPPVRRIGAGHALAPSCKDVREAAGYLQAGDTMLIGDVRILGTDWDAIIDTMTWIHERNISLAIDNISYYDRQDYRDGRWNSVTTHYQLVTSLYSLMSTVRTIDRSPVPKKKPRKPRKGARGPEAITIASYESKAVKSAFRRYCTDKSMKIQDMKDLFLKKGKVFPSPVTFHRLVCDMDTELLKEHAGERDFVVFRSVRHRYKNGLPWRGDQVEKQGKQGGLPVS